MTATVLSLRGLISAFAIGISLLNPTAVSGETATPPRIGVLAAPYASAPANQGHGADVLVSYAPSIREAGRKMAAYVDRILKGARAGELPIEQLSKYELVIDLRVAQTMGLDVPQDLLLRADEVIR